MDAAALLDFKVYPDRVVVVIETGQKYVVDRLELAAEAEKKSGAARVARVRGRKAAGE